MSKRKPFEILRRENNPVVSFASRGTLFHESPPLKQWLLALCAERSAQTNEGQVDAALLEMEVRSIQEVENASDQPGILAESFDWSFLLKKLLGEVDAEQVDKVREAYRQTQKFVIPKFVVDVLQELRRRGFRLCIVSNERKDLVEILRLYHLLEFFEAVILAEEVGVAKPDQKIFEIAAADLGVETTQLVHVGDHFAFDVIPAIRVGARAVVYDPSGLQAKAALQSMEAADQSEKSLGENVVSFERLKQNRYWSQALVLNQFEELLECLQ